MRQNGRPAACDGYIPNIDWPRTYDLRDYDRSASGLHGRGARVPRGLGYAAVVPCRDAAQEADTVARQPRPAYLLKGPVWSTFCSLESDPAIWGSESAWGQCGTSGEAGIRALHNATDHRRPVPPGI